MPLNITLVNLRFFHAICPSSITYPQLSQSLQPIPVQNGKKKKKLELTTKTQAHMEQPKYKTNKAQPQVK